MLFGNVELNIMSMDQEDFAEQNFISGKLSIVRCDGSVAEFSVNEILHKNLIALDETGNEL